MTGAALVLYDDALARTFAPFALTRPLGTMRAGAELIHRRWSQAMGAPPAQFASSPHLATFVEDDAPRAVAERVRAGSIVANARCVVALGALDADAGAGVWRVSGRVAAVRLARDLPAESLADGTCELESLVEAGAREVAAQGRWIDAAWDLVGQLPEQLFDDAAAIATASKGVATSAERIGSHAVVVEASAYVDPLVVLDGSAGAIVIRAGARVEAFTRIAGPCVIGPGTQILGGRITGSAFGEQCRVHGDVSTSLFVGHANKAHEGFVGHSVVGRWANLGAGTTTSNLKNSYGAVKLWTPAGERDTGLTFLGSLIGDHAKLGIGTMLGTGTVVGAGANVFGTVRPPKRVPPFAWGDAPPYETFSLDKFLEVAARVMARRKVPLDHGQVAMLKAAHALAAGSAW